MEKTVIEVLCLQDYGIDVPLFEGGEEVNVRIATRNDTFKPFHDFFGSFSHYLRRRRLESVIGDVKECQLGQFSNSHGEKL